MISGFEKALLGLLLIVLMMGMGATLTLEDFKNILKKPKGVLIGLASQFGWMPAVAFGLATAFSLPKAMGLSLLIVGCTPGGTTSNMFTYYAKADLALSISMTVCSTIIAIVMMPLLLLIYGSHFTSDAITVPYRNIIVTLALVLVPVAIGVLIRAKKGVKVAKIVETVGSYSGIFVLVLLVVSGLRNNYQLLLDSSAGMLISCVALGAIGMGLGYLAASIAKLDLSARRAVSLETGIQNSPLAIGVIVFSFPKAAHATMLWLPLLYALFVLISASIFTVFFRRTHNNLNMPETTTSLSERL